MTPRTPSSSRPSGERGIALADFWEKLWHGLRGELLRTILLAVTVSILLYTGLQPVSRVVLQSFYTNSDFLQTKTDAVGTLIQQNVAESGISSRQVRRITDWYSRGDQPGGCILRVEKDGVVIYDSALNNVEYYRTYSQASKTLDESAYLRTYPLEFSDGSATLYAYGYFDFAVDEAVRTAEFWLCLVLGIGIVLWAVWKKLNYMETLEQSIRVLEGGQLDYKVPVRGTDELAQMAQSLNEMSASLKQQMEQVQQAQQQRYELVTSLSHDLRTPLTAQLGYLELLAEHRYQTPQQHDDYLNKCVRSCQSVIELSNGLFRIASGEAPRREPRLEALDAPEVFCRCSPKSFPCWKNRAGRCSTRKPTAPRAPCSWTWTRCAASRTIWCPTCRNTPTQPSPSGSASPGRETACACAFPTQCVPPRRATPTAWG